MEKMHPESWRGLLWCLVVLGIAIDNSTAQAGTVALPHFQFAAPASWGWQHVDSKDPAAIVFTSQRDSAVYTITLLEQQNPYGTRTGSKQVAERYMQAELSYMVEKGEQTGLYQVLDVERGEEIVGGRLYYTMKYKTRGPTHHQAAALYLHLPRQERREYFLVARYSAVAPTRELIAKPFEADFVSLLESVVHWPVGRADAHHSETPGVESPSLDVTSAKVHALTQMTLPLEDLPVRRRIGDLPDLHKPFSGKVLKQTIVLHHGR